MITRRKLELPLNVEKWKKGSVYPTANWEKLRKNNWEVRVNEERFRALPNHNIPWFCAWADNKTWALSFLLSVSKIGTPWKVRRKYYNRSKFLLFCYRYPRCYRELQNLKYYRTIFRIQKLNTCRKFFFYHQVFNELLAVSSTSKLSKNIVSIRNDQSKMPLVNTILSFFSHIILLCLF